MGTGASSKRAQDSPNKAQTATVIMVKSDIVKPQNETILDEASTGKSTPSVSTQSSSRWRIGSGSGKRVGSASKVQPLPPALTKTNSESNISIRGRKAAPDDTSSSGCANGWSETVEGSEGLNETKVESLRKDKDMLVVEDKNTTTFERTMAELEGRNLNLMDQVESLQRELCLLQNERATSEHKLSEDRSEVNDQLVSRLQKELDATKEQMNRVRIQYKRKVRQRNVVLAECKQACSLKTFELTDIIDKLKDENLSLQSQLTSLQENSVAGTNDRSAPLERPGTSHGEGGTTRMGLILELSNKVSEQDAEISRLNNVISEQEKAIRERLSTADDDNRISSSLSRANQRSSGDDKISTSSCNTSVSKRNDSASGNSEITHKLDKICVMDNDILDTSSLSGFTAHPPSGLRQISAPKNRRSRLGFKSGNSSNTSRDSVQKESDSKQTERGFEKTNEKPLIGNTKGGNTSKTLHLLADEIDELLRS